MRRILLAATLAGIAGISAVGCSADSADGGDSGSADDSQSAANATSSTGSDAAGDGDSASCPGTTDADSTVDIATAKLYIEHNFTDADTGVHGAFDDHGWSQLCVFDPGGNQIWALEPRSQLGDLGVAGVFFESREPPNDEYSVSDLLADFPEGEYEVRGLNVDGTTLVGSATFTHSIPATPSISSPALGGDPEEADPPVVNAQGLLVAWEPVTETIEGAAVEISGYEVIITKEVDDDPFGFSRPTLDVHVGPDTTELQVAPEFVEAGTLYELEVLALEKSGNQTISVGFFATE